MFQAIIISRADFPIIIKYDGKDKVVSPRERFKIADIELLEGKLPAELKLQRI